MRWAGVIALALATAVVALQARTLWPDRLPPGFRADLLVVGGSPGGVAAALAAAREGMLVALVEPRPYLGTVWTGAMLNMIDLNRSPDDGRHLTGGIFLEVYREIGGMTFNPRRVRELLLDKVEAEPGITLLLGTAPLRPLLAGTLVRGAAVRLPDGREAEVAATVTIDATEDGDLAAAAGVPYTLGRQASGIDARMMPATLLFRLADLDWPAVVSYAHAHRRGRQPSGAHAGYAWGFREVMRGYRARGPGLSAHDLNAGRMADGTVWLNTLQVHDVDGTSPASRGEGVERARREIPHLVTYLRAHAPGFVRARLIEVAPELYIRETRHLQGLYTLTARDITEGIRFWDRIGVASYPVDLHQYIEGERYPYPPTRTPYTIPLRALIASRADGLFVASRAFSATYQAAGSARVVPTTIAMGQGAGVAAAVVRAHRATPHGLAERRDLVREVQHRLERAGAIINH